MFLIADFFSDALELRTVPPESKKGVADGLTQPPSEKTKAEIKSQMPYHYTTGELTNSSLGTVHTFEFYRFRFHFRALDAVRFPPGKSSNVIRGAFGSLLRETAPAAYLRLFEPGSWIGGAPSGLRDWPRPFLFRTAHLDGCTLAQGGEFHFDVHVFDVRQPSLPAFREVFSKFAGRGMGTGRGRAEMTSSVQLDLHEGATEVGDEPGLPLLISLDAPQDPVCSVTLRFLSPTELKGGGEVAARPEFPILFSRLRDRLSTLRGFYGAGPLVIDFRETLARAQQIRLTRCELTHEETVRKSGRTGQTHSLGGFTGIAEYEGELGEFLPWLEAARWVGVGRQTVWGKGDVRVVEAGRC
jgi:hypothetical protein